MRYKMVALDIDGTLLDSEENLRLTIIETVREVMNRGVLVTLVTGRSFHFVNKIASKIGIDVPLILEAGSIIQDSTSGTVLYENAIAPNLLKDLVYEIVRNGHQPFLCCSPLGNDEEFSGPLMYDNPAYPGDAQQHFPIQRLSYNDLCAITHVTNVSVFHQQDVLGPLRSHLLSKSLYRIAQKQFRKRFPIIYMLEIMNETCSKATALKHLAQMYAIEMREILAIGDDIPDLEMLEEVGMGVAMGNALPIVREKAKTVVSTNDEDGVVEALRKFVLTT